MAELNPPTHLQNDGTDADKQRRWMASVFADREGVIGDGALLVTEKSGTPDMSVDVAAGRAIVLGDEATFQGSYHVENDATVNLAIAAADPTNDRIDLVVARVKDAVYSGATNEWALEVVTGTPAASPSEPTVPDNAYVLARVVVGNGVSSITNTDITDRREPAVARGGHIVTVVYTGSGTFDKADYTGMRKARVRVQGAGGGGGGNPSTGSSGNASSGGGGGGGYAETILDVEDLSASETVTVGSGGAGAGGANDGADGGDSSFGLHATGGGGRGGIQGQNSTTAFHAIGGSGGTASVSTGNGFSVRGSDGGYGVVTGGIRVPHNRGGGSMFGADQSPVSSGGGHNGLGHGGGGSGANSSSSLGTRNGGDGADGIVVVEVYA